MIRVRFNLGAGKNFKKWKVQWDTGAVAYLEPDHVSLVMRGCKLKNRPTSARRIFEGHEKFVCAWIECSSIEIKDPIPVDGPQAKYNPRRQPNWTVNESIVDGASFEQLVTNGRNVYII